MQGDCKTMKTTEFSARGLAALKPRAERFEVKGGGGLKLRVYPSGQKSFRWQGPPCRDVRCKGGRTHRHTFTLGDFDGLHMTGLADALKRLEELRTKRGHAEAVEALLAPEDVPQATGEHVAAVTVRELADKFYTEVILNRRKVPEAALDILNRDIKGAIGNVRLSALTADIVAKPTRAAVARGAKGHAVKVLGLTKQLLTWGAALEHLKRNPAEMLDAENMGAVIGQRDRTLSTEEVGEVLAGLGRASIEESTRTAAKLLLATGLRSHELLSLRWTDVDLDAATLTVQVVNQKLSLKASRKAKVYTVPLSPYAVKLFKRQVRETGSADFVFASFGEAGRVTDKVVTRACARMRKSDKRLAKMPRWTPHDFRRTLASWASEKYDPTTAQQLLGHNLNRILGSGVASTYDTSTGLRRRREALDAWGRVLEGLDRQPKTAKVVNIRG